MAYMSMSLHAVNHRLTNVPVKQLPHLASCLASSISNCGELLSTPQSQKSGKTDSDNAVQVHKLITRLGSLLQDRTYEGRWTAVVLVKALVEAGQWEILRSSEPFVRGLISILAKSDPVSTKKMCIITLTRIFHLTYQYPTLVREITTPSLPGFITSALNLISVKPSSEPVRRLKPNTPFVEVVLQAVNELIARHPTIFRPFTAQIHSLLQVIIGSTSPTFPEHVLEIAQQLFISLHNCAPKNTGGDEWKSACRMTITSVHAASSYVLRAIVEQWESVDPSLRQMSQPQNYSQEVGNGPDALGLEGWQGLNSGINRLVVLLRMLSGFVGTATASTVTIPVGAILDLTSRLNMVVYPSGGSDIQANPQIGRAEREQLLTELPRIHIACMKLLLHLVNALETSAIPVAQNILEQALWVFRAEQFSRDVRTAVYDLVCALLTRIGPSMTKQSVSSLASMIRKCCHDLLPPTGNQGAATEKPDPKSKNKSSQATVNADSFLNPGLKQVRQTSSSSSFPDLTRAASELLAAALTHTPSEFMSPALRAEVDRTLILTSDKNAMLASVLNPFPAMQGRGVGTSILPFLARSYPAETEVECLIRPRMPVVMSGPTTNGYVPMEDDEDEDEDAAATAVPTSTATGFLKPTPTPTLQHHDMMDVEKDIPSPPSKRSYADEVEQPAASSAVPSATTTTSSPGSQSKKARFEQKAAAAVTQPPLDAASPAAFTGTAAISVPTSSIAGPAPVQTPKPAQSSIAKPSASAAAGAAEDESDDEMPSLNVDPDTDDEDEDEE
ncbi:rRNA processing/ribosome biogenesis-domain-containing protein [Aspergillus welwitschiae]|uniref:Pre-rRNA-processing protein RIX1 n=1 Tax=Aspergillus welwitschiae TaxID=1341132 RepID=A0A3F3Q7U6_9EURO|nr:rRNA processing/ribosome biogenesis-domain-containing protein [Aspergillus welwitschiae]RDH35195.1 rRNA processing/ribosome biogenesis-domain-containing protein [Aspergillus welwitschiae]